MKITEWIINLENIFKKRGDIEIDDYGRLEGCSFCNTKSESNLDYNEIGISDNYFIIEKIRQQGKYYLHFSKKPDNVIEINFCPKCGRFLL